MFGNWLKTALLMAGVVALFGAVGALVGGGSGMLLALVLGGAANLFAYWYSDRMVLSLYRAREVDASAAPQLYATVQRLAARAGLPMPRVYLIDEAQPNAFATGRDPGHAAVAASTGLVQLLSARELAGVLGHELAHVKHRDILISTIAATVAGAVSALAQFGLFFGSSNERDDGSNPLLALLVIVFAPLAAVLVQLAISRAREFEADRGGAEISGDPLALASALAKIDAHVHGIPLDTAELHPATAQMMIVNPLSGGGVSGLFATHPSTEERIARLRAMA